MGSKASGIIVGLITVATISAVVQGPNAPLIITGLGQAFTNLLRNATQAGTERPQGGQR